MTQRRILVLDCTPRNDPSEGLMLKEFFNICKLHKPSKGSSLYYKINSKKEFLSKLNTGKKYDIIHISAHGPPEGKVGIGNGSTWLATPEEISQTNHRSNLVFANACTSNKKTLAEAFSGAKYFLAPQTEVLWIDAALFSMTFYKRFIVDGYSLRSSFEFARKRTQTAKDYTEYWL